MLELVYLSVALTAGYQAAVILRRAGRAQRAYAYMLLGDAALAAFAFAGSSPEGNLPLAGAVGAACIGAAVCLIVVPPVLRGLSRRLSARDRLTPAIALAELRELLSPGMGGRQEADVLRVVRDVRSGQIEGALTLLRGERMRARSPEARRALQDRIITMLLYVNRWRDATSVYEAEAPEATGFAASAELLRAYGELGELEQAARLIERLEASPAAADPVQAVILARARLLFLAFTGRVGGVTALASANGPLAVLPDAARTYWVGTARFYSGDREGARTVLEHAGRAAGSEARWHQIIRERMELVDDESRPLPEPSPAVSQLADHIDRLARTAAEAGPVPAQAPALAPARSWVTNVLIGVNLIVFAACALYGDSTADPRILSRFGANLEPAVRAGEYWRLPASVFLHLGIAHIALNMLSLLALGRLVESLFGSGRFFALYLLSGIAGAALSAMGGDGRMSVGASGAVFGLLGAAIIDLATKRGRGAPARKEMLRTLLFLVVINLGIGLAYEMIDQSAHIGGLVAGGVLAVLLSPSGLIGARRWARPLVVALVAAAVGSLGYAGFGVATTTPADTLDRVGWEQVRLRGASFEVPRLWALTPDPLLSARLHVEADDLVEPAERFAQHEAELRSESSVSALTSADPAFVLPPGWSGRELRYRYDDGKYRANLRRLVFQAPHRGRALVVTILTSEKGVGDIQPAILRLLRSVKLG